MTATEINIKVGTVMIFVGCYNAEPVTVNVSKVTPSGLVRFTGPSGKESGLYKFNGRDEYYPKDRNGSRYGRGERLYLHTPEKLAELIDRHETIERAKADKRVLEDANRAAHEVKRLAEIDELKLRMGGNYDNNVLLRTLLGEDRLVTIGLPVKPERVERKGETEIVIIRLKTDKNYWDYNSDEKAERVEGYMTVASKGSSSFGSYSGVYGKDDESVIWECLRSAYNSW